MKPGKIAEIFAVRDLFAIKYYGGDCPAFSDSDRKRCKKIMRYMKKNNLEVYNKGFKFGLRKKK